MAEDGGSVLGSGEGGKGAEDDSNVGSEGAWRLQQRQQRQQQRHTNFRKRRLLSPDLGSDTSKRWSNSGVRSERGEKGFFGISVDRHSHRRNGGGGGRTGDGPAGRTGGEAVVVSQGATGSQEVM